MCVSEASGQNRQRIINPTELIGSTDFGKAIFEGSVDPILITDLADMVIAANSSFHKLFGYRPGELSGRSLPSHLNGEKDIKKTWLKACRKGEGIKGYETIRKTKDGRPVSVLISVSPICDQNGRLKFISYVYRDISELKKTERVLLESEEKYRSFVEMANDGIAIMQDLELKYVNPRLAEMLGYTVEAMIGTKGSDYVHPQELPRLMDMYRRRVAGEKVPSVYETLLLAKGGSEVPVEVNIVVVSYDAEPADLIFFRDITDRKKTEKALHESEEKYRLVSENIPVVVYSAFPDNQSTPIFISGRIEDLTGYTTQQFYDDPALWDSIIFPDDRERVWNDIKTHRKQKVDLDTEYRIVTRKNEVRWIKDRATPMIDENGKIARIYGFVEDVTIRKKAEMALIESEERYKMLFNSAQDAVFVHTITLDGKPGKFTEVNESACRMLGYCREELLQMSHSDIVTPEQKDRLNERGKDFLSSGHILFESDMMARDGHLVPVEVHAHVFDHKGRQTVLSIVRDITERRKTEEALRNSEKFNRAITDCSPLGISVRSTKGRLVACNESWQRIWGISEKELRDEYETERAEFEFDQSDEYLGDWKPEVKRIYQEGGTLHIPELRVHSCKDDFAKWVSHYFYSIEDTSGEVERVVILTEDISERKRIEAERDKNQRQVNALFEGVGVLLWSVSDKDGELYYEQVNEAFASVMGLKPADYNGKPVKNLHSKTEYARIRNSYDWARQGKLHSYEVSVGNGAGKRYFEIQIIPLPDKDGSIKRFIGAGLDITRRRKVEHTVRLERQAFSLIADSALGSRSIQELCQRVLDGLVDNLGFDAGSIQLFDEIENSLFLKALAGEWKGKITEESKRQSIDNSEYVSSFVARSKQPLFASDVSRHEIYATHHRRLDSENIRSIICWPILDAHQELIGLIQLIGTKPIDFSDDLKKFARIIMGMFATALERKIAEKKAEERVQELQAVNSLSVRLADAGPEEDIYILIGDALKEITGAKAAAVTVFDPDNNSLVTKHIAVDSDLLRQATRFLGTTPLGMRMEVSPEIYNKMLEQVVNITDDLTETTFGKIPPELGKLIKNTQGIGYQASIALQYKGELTGLATCIMDKKDSPPSPELLKIFANVAAFSIQRKRIYDELIVSEERYRVFTEKALVGVYIYDKGRLLFVNPAMEQITGYSREELLNMDTAEMEVPDREKTAKMWEEKRKQEDSQIDQYFMHLKRKDGKIAVLEFRTHPVEYQGKRVTLGNCVDISERKKVEDTLRRERKAYSIIADAAVSSTEVSDLCHRLISGLVKTMGFDVGTVQISDAEEEKLTLIAKTGTRSHGVYCDDSPQYIVDKKYVGTYVARTKKPIFASDVQTHAIYRELKQRLDEKNVKSLISWPIMGSRCKFLGVLQLFSESIKDISTQDIGFFSSVAEMFSSVLERQLTEQELRIKNTAIESSISGVALADLEGNLTYVNDACLDMWGYESKYEAIGEPAANFFKNKRKLVHVMKALRDDGYWSGNMEGVRKDGSIFPVHLSVSLVRDDSGTPICSISSFVDVTQQVQAEEKIKASLAEKEVLLKEIHHRVKNNLQIISSLLKLQSSRTSDEGELNALRQSRNRIQSIALIHEKLYQSRDLSRVNFAEYVKGLVNSMLVSWGRYARGIKIDFDLEPIQLGIDKAIPCALIVNELVSNTIKHAFTEGEKGKVTVRLSREEEGMLRLAVSDDGKGIPEGFNANESTSMGLQLVQTLVDQIKGGMSVSTGQGTTFTILFMAGSEAGRST